MALRILVCALFYYLIFLPVLTLNALSSIQYTVKKGDSLYSIARKYNISVEKLKNTNNLKTDLLTPNQKLILPVALPTKDGKWLRYRVIKGDTLSDIAYRYGMSSRDLMKANNLKRPDLHIGQEILIPINQKSALSKENGSKERSVKKATKTTDRKTFKNTYIVKSGDSLWTIARNFGVTVSQLKLANNLKDNSIKPNQTLVIPSKITEISQEEKNKKKSVSTASKNNSSSSGIKLPTASLKKDKTTNTPKRKTSSLSRKEVLQKIASKKIVKSETSHSEFYIVKPGDTLSQIAQKFNKKTKDLIAINGLTSSKIYAGQKLKIKGKPTPKKIKKEKKSEKVYIISHKILPGDTLITIAKRYRSNVSDIKKLNSLDSDRIRVGDILKIPTKQISSPKYQESIQAPLVYKVKKGDSLSSISKRFGVSVEDIKAANKIKGEKIIAGRQLYIPTSSSKVKYKVRDGDTLITIAKKFGTTVGAIKRQNNLKSNLIYKGQILKVPTTYRNYTQKKSNYDYEDSVRQRLVEVAKRYLGAPYKFGGESPRTGIDCSAYVNKVFNHFDIKLPRTARDIFKKGEWVSKNELEVGDLVFFRTYAQYPSHVGIYIGNSKFIHASSAQKKVTISSLNRRYYRKRYIGAKRIPLTKKYKSYSRNISEFQKRYN